MNAVQDVHKLLVLRYRYQSSICSVKTQIFIFLRSKPMERRKKFKCFFWIWIHGWLSFSSKKEKNKGDRDFKPVSDLTTIYQNHIFVLMSRYASEQPSVRDLVKPDIVDFSLNLFCLASPVFSGWDTATAWAIYCGPVKARTQHRELRALLFTNSVWVL